MTPWSRFIGRLLPQWLVVPALVLIYSFMLFAVIALLGYYAGDQIVYFDVGSSR